jgi:hypothetical protein
MISYFSTGITELLQDELLRCLHLIFCRDVIAVLANLTGKSDGDAMFSLFCHNI